MGGYAAAQVGAGLQLLAAWDGASFADKAERLHAACRHEPVDSTLDESAQRVLRLTHPGLPELLCTPLDELSPDDLSRIATTLNHALLEAELSRCLPALGNAVMRPVALWLEDHAITSVTLVPCGMLPAFPLTAASVDGEAIVSDRLSVTVAPSARSVLTRPENKGSRDGVYAIGNPRPTHQELRWGEAEAQTVAAIAGTPERARVGQEATREWLDECLAKARMVTASCHGTFDEDDFLRSRLLLANERTLTLAEALSHDLDLTGLRLLVLSACQTAVMDVRGAHGEVRSLAVGMLQAGARAVLAPLWAVDDEATYLLMVRFAHEWLPAMETEDPAAALARAQSWLRSVTHRELAKWETGQGIAPGQSGLATIRGRGDGYTMAQAEALTSGLALRRGANNDLETPYSNPIYWAGFQIHGR